MDTIAAPQISSKLKKKLKGALIFSTLGDMKPLKPTDSIWNADAAMRELIRLNIESAAEEITSTAENCEASSNEEPQLKLTDAQQKFLDLYDQTLEALVAAGLRESRAGLPTGVLGEIVVCLRYGLTPRAEGTQGADATDKDGNKVELKHSSTPIEKQANFIFILPAAVSAVTASKKKGAKKVSSEQLWAIREDLLDKSHRVLFVHDATSSRIFLNATFVGALLCRAYVRNRSKAINISMTPCLKCTKIHKLEYYKKCEATFLELLQGIEDLDAAKWSRAVRPTTSASDKKWAELWALVDSKTAAKCPTAAAVV